MTTMILWRVEKYWIFTIQDPVLCIYSFYNIFFFIYLLHIIWFEFIVLCVLSSIVRVKTDEVKRNRITVLHLLCNFNVENKYLTFEYARFYFVLVNTTMLWIICYTFCVRDWMEFCVAVVISNNKMHFAYWIL